MKTFNQYITEKLIINKNLKNVAPLIDNYMEAKHFIVLRFKYSVDDNNDNNEDMFSFSCVIVKKFGKNNLHQNTYEFRGGGWAGGWIFGSILYDNFMFTKLKNTYFIFFPLKYFKETYDYKSILNDINDIEYITSDDIYTFFNIDLYDICFKKYGLISKKELKEKNFENELHGERQLGSLDIRIKEIESLNE